MSLEPNPIKGIYMLTQTVKLDILVEFWGYDMNESNSAVRNLEYDMCSAIKHSEENK